MTSAESFQLTPEMNRSQMDASLSHVLIIDDDICIRQLISEKLRLSGLLADQAESMPEALDLIRSRFYHAILLDNFIGDVLGIDFIETIISASPRSLIVMLTGDNSIDSVMEALNRGASSFLVKTDSIDANINKFLGVMAKSKITTLKSGYDFIAPEIISESPEMTAIFRRLAKVSPTDLSVLITGESGTGKELIARAVHRNSARAETGPFIAVNCGAISENLLEAELFGSKKGSYTGSTHDKKGYFETCCRGTLFLDEVGEMPPILQVKLLRVLQEKEVTPVGSCHPIKVDVRIVAATNRRLLLDVEQGRFRKDLYFRLSTILVELPPLRERYSDIQILLRHFIDQANQKFSKQVKYPDCAMAAKIRAYSWPGNIRELQSAVERSVVLAESNQMHLEDLIPASGTHENYEVEKVSTDSNLQKPLDYTEAKKAFERDYINHLLSATHGNVSEAAKLSGQYRPAIYRYLRKYGLDSEMFRHSPKSCS
jgi:DNA-binding NtrC family response regulator